MVVFFIIWLSFSTWIWIPINCRDLWQKLKPKKMIFSIKRTNKFLKKNTCVSVLKDLSQIEQMILFGEQSFLCFSINNLVSNLSPQPEQGAGTSWRVFRSPLVSVRSSFFRDFGFGECFGFFDLDFLSVGVISSTSALK